MYIESILSKETKNIYYITPVFHVA